MTQLLTKTTATNPAYAHFNGVSFVEYSRAEMEELFTPSEIRLLKEGHHVLRSGKGTIVRYVSVEAAAKQVFGE